MEEKKVISPISMEEFKERAKEIAAHNHLERAKLFLDQGFLSLRRFEGVSKFKSVRRAIRRGHASLYGDIYPNRPFSNKKRDKGTETYNRRMVYGQFRKLT